MQMITTTNKRVKDLIAAGKTKDALDFLIDNSIHSDSELISLSGEYSRITKENVQGRLDGREFNLIMNRINRAILAIAEDLERKKLVNTEKTQNVGTNSNLRPVQAATGYWGYMDNNDKWVVKPTFLEAFIFKNGLSVVKPHPAYYLFFDGEKCLYDVIMRRFFGFDDTNIALAEGYFLLNNVEEIEEKYLTGEYHSCSYGFVKSNGKWLLRPIFYRASNFFNEIAVVETHNSELGYINTRGEYILEPVFENKLYWRNPDGSYSAFDLKDEVSYRNNLDYFVASYKKKQGVLNRKGEWIIKANHDMISFCFFPNSKKISAFLCGNRIERERKYSFPKGLEGYIDFYAYNISGIKISNYPSYVIRHNRYEANYFYNQSAQIFFIIEDIGKLDSFSNLGIIDIEGNIVLEPTHFEFSYDKDEYNHYFVAKRSIENGNKSTSEAYYFDGTLIGCNESGHKYISPKTPNYLSPLSEKTNEKFGYINFKGEWSIPPTFFDAKPFGNGLAPVKNEDHKWGYINQRGEFIIKVQFETACVFSDGYARVDDSWRTREEVKFINTRGELVCNFNNKNSGYYFDDYVYNDFVTIQDKNGNVGFFNILDNSIINPKFIDGFGYRFIQGTCIVYFRGSEDSLICALIDTKGDFIVKLENSGDIRRHSRNNNVFSISFNNDGSYLWGVVDSTGKYILEPQIERGSESSNLQYLYEIGNILLIDDHMQLISLRDV